ncbi:MAG: hypothetical protein ABSB49_13370 [Polyangia bacterium]|jgi:hypothetical protein
MQLLTTSYMSGCVALPSTANGSTNYVFGLMAMGAGVTCIVGVEFTDSACATQLDANSEEMNVAASSSWTAASEVVTPMAGANSVGVDCTSPSGNANIDNLYFDVYQAGNGF